MSAATAVRAANDALGLLDEITKVLVDNRDFQEATEGGLQARIDRVVRSATPQIHKLLEHVDERGLIVATRTEEPNYFGYHEVLEAGGDMFDCGCYKDDDLEPERFTLFAAYDTGWSFNDNLSRFPDIYGDDNWVPLERDNSDVQP